MTSSFLQRLDQGILVCDGAMGTLLYEKGGFTHLGCFEGLNLSAPDLVKEVHLGYRKAGADILQTNTFGANRFRLRHFGLEDQVNELNQAGARLARHIASDDLFVAGAVGPLGTLLEPLGTVSFQEAWAAFREQIEVLADAGVDLLMVETMTDANEALQALRAARDVNPQLAVVVQMTLREDGTTSTGMNPEEFTRRLDEAGADVIGLNCSVGPAPMLEALKRMGSVTGRKLSVQPNAGLPRRVEGRYIYLSSPEYMADYAVQFLKAGAGLVGGCCGTTPDHIRMMKNALRATAPGPARVQVQVPVPPAELIAPPPPQERSRLGRKLSQRKFLTLVEIAPPKGSDPKKEIEGARYLARQGIDAVNIPEDHGSSPRMNAQSLALRIQKEAGIECLVHYCCRERNLLTIQSDLLGAHAVGLRNILAVTDDAPQPGDYRAARAVFDVDSVGLIRILKNLSVGLDVGGNPLTSSTFFLVGVGTNPGALNRDEELARLESKVEAGANFALTLPVFDGELLQSFLEAMASRMGKNRIPVVAGLWPLTSYRNAEFLNNEFAGLSVPDPVLDRMRKVGSGERARAEGIQVARELLEQIRPMAQGVQLATPFGRYDLAIEVLRDSPGWKSSPEAVRAPQPEAGQAT